MEFEQDLVPLTGMSPARRRLFQLLLARRGADQSLSEESPTLSAHETFLLGRGAAGPWRRGARLAATVALPDSVDAARAATALRALARRHPALRAAVGSDGCLDRNAFPEGPTLRVCPSVDDDLTRASAPDEPLTRWYLVPSGLIVVGHELVADRYALVNVLLPEWAGYLHSGHAGGPAPRAVDGSGDAQRSLDFWAAELAGAVPPVARSPRPPRAARRVLPIDADRLRRVIRAGRRRGATPVMSLLAVWAVALGRWAGLDTVTVLVCSENRQQASTRDVVAHLMSLLPLRIPVAEPVGVIDRTAAALRRAYPHTEVPWELVAREGLFPFTFGYYPAPDPLTIDGVACPVTELDPCVPPGALGLDIVHSGGEYAVSLLYDAGSHDEPAIANIAARVGAAADVLDAGG